MKKIILVAFTFALLTSGCKVFKSSKKSDVPKTENTVETKVFSVPAPKNTIRENPVSDTMYETVEKPVSMRSEKFTMSADDQAAYGSKSFFVIVGSFSSNENAGRFKQELIPQGFRPIILHSETGYFRVCVDSFSDEAAARSRVQRIRTEYPKYADSWLLIKK
ncbi:MAG TPA: SPOR domain-containing protein [Prolixibacteraceae bacterium]|nr:SPOR domain-containing protein [Prolixibacteraceae bacterium]